MNLEKILETYTLEEILEYNNLSPLEVLETLDDWWDLEFPPEPVDAS